MIVIGIDDTDIKGSPGTNQLARHIVERLGPAGKSAIVCRHQLFFDPRVPFTSQNGSASIQLPHADDVPRHDLIETVTHVMQSWYIEGSDPGLAVTGHSTAEMKAFAARAQTEIVTQEEARAVAERSGCYLAGLGGSNGGIIGALSAIALVLGGHDGRVIHLDGWPWPDPLSGVQTVATIRTRGVKDIRTTSGLPYSGELIDVGKRLRPNWRNGHVVLFVEPATDPHTPAMAARLL